jgi:hypothetical protein
MANLFALRRSGVSIWRIARELGLKSNYCCASGKGAGNTVSLLAGGELPIAPFFTAYLEPLDL